MSAPSSCRRVAVPLALAALLLGCSSSVPTALTTGPTPPTGPAWFEDATDAAGIDFTHDPGPTGTWFMPQSMGSGCAFLDFDGDGLLDLYLLNFGGPGPKSVNRLYRQLPGGKFADATDGSGLGIAGWNHGVAVGDVNNDGRPDLLVTQYGGVRLFLNQGGGKFADATEGSGLVNPVWGMSAAFLDFDRDGRLDLVVANYLDYDPKNPCFAPNGKQDFCGPTHFPHLATRLFRNVGQADGRVRFEDVSIKSGVGRVPGPGLGVTVGDFDGDGWPDIFIANDGQPNRLWVNQKDGTFKDEAVSRGVAYTAMGKAFAGMGVGVGDVDGDGLNDVFVTHLNTETHTLWKQGPRGRFVDQTAEAGLAGPTSRGTGFGTVLADFTNSGFPDVMIANGRVYLGGPAKDTALGFWETYAEKNQVFANDGTGKFRDVSAANPAVCGQWNVARGVACADYDNDGGLDLLVTTIGGRARLFRNVAPDRGHWLKVRAIDPALNRDAYGAEVRVTAGGRDRMKLVSPAESYLSSGTPVAHVGLGKAETFDAITVTWPDGTAERFPGGAADRLVELRKGAGRKP